MIKRKQGETNNQLVKRCNVLFESLNNENKALRLQNEELAIASETHNPRTMGKYVDEAQQLFTTVALVEHAIRTNELDFAKAVTQEQLGVLGFDMVQIYQNETLAEGAYKGSI